jgi:hypothetical protein
MTLEHDEPRGYARLNAPGILTALLVLITSTSCGKSSVDPGTNPEPVASVAVSPASATIMEGNSTMLTAIPRDAGGNVLSGRAVAWASDNAAASVDADGHVRGESPGAATITATSEGKSGTSAITITVAPPPTNALVGAGDIANGSSGAEVTAKLLDNIAGTVFTAGDNAYPDGSAANFSQYYDPTWGRHKARTRPSPGNHDYHTSGAADYYAYFGANAGPAGQGYYSYDLGDWHIISLNSEISMSVGSAQEQWLRADLTANSKDCILAYWHRPRFSSGVTHGSSTEPSPLWEALYQAGAEIVVVGHEHNYERFAPQTANGVADPARGIRQFVAGMGGASHYALGTPIANSEASNTDTYGVLKFTLGPGTYAWEFIAAAGGTYTDSGSGTCHR